MTEILHDTTFTSLTWFLVLVYDGVMQALYHQHYDQVEGSYNEARTAANTHL